MRSLLGIVFLAGVALPDDAPDASQAPNLARQSPPAAKVSLDHAIKTAVDWLVKNQKPDGSWGKRTSGRTWEVTAGVPGGHYAFEAATTAIAWMGLNDAPYQPEASKQAQAKALQWLVKNVRVKRARGGELYNTWSFGFGLQALAQALKKQAPGATEVELRATAAELVKAIGIYQTPDGGLGYYDFRTRTYRPSWSTSFTTGTGLIALHLAEQAGVDVPAKVVAKSRDHLLRCRTPTGSYLYGSYMKYYPHAGINKPQGSSMRTQTCNLALRFAGAKITDQDLRQGLEDLLVKHHRFAIAGVRRPRPHESWYAVSGYFYLYGHMYAAMVLEQLPDTQRKYFSKKLIEAVLKTRQPDGSFWDYPLYGYHKPYGTGFALMALARCTPPKTK
jgi:hypothetical protein